MAAFKAVLAVSASFCSIAVHNAVVMEEVAKMAYRAETINARIQPAPQELQDKHYFRKHGENAYYGQK